MRLVRPKRPSREVQGLRCGRADGPGARSRLFDLDDLPPIRVALQGIK